MVIFRFWMCAFFVVAIFISDVSQAQVFGDQSQIENLVPSMRPEFPIDSTAQLARDIVVNTNHRIQWCALSVLNANRAINPPFNARLVIINRWNRVLAYLYDFWDWNQSRTYSYANPDGTYAHRISWQSDALAVWTPFQATPVASVQDDLGGRVFHCQGGIVDSLAFARCVDQYYSQLIANQLCRFRESP
jgi:hypothetical protein